jgi:uncharacterized membrane protein YkoI
MHPKRPTADRPSPAVLVLWTAALCLWSGQAGAQGASTRISQEQAMQAAQKALPGKVTDVTLEKKRGKTVYVVELAPDKGGEETDVLVDPETGQVLGTEQ